MSSLELKLQYASICSIGTCSRNSDVVEKLLEFIKPLVNSVLRRPSIDTYALCLASGASLIFKIDSDGTTIGLEFSVCGQIGVIFLVVYCLFYNSKNIQSSWVKMVSICSLECTLIFVSILSVGVFTNFRLIQERSDPLQNGGNKWMDHTGPGRACVRCWTRRRRNDQPVALNGAYVFVVDMKL